MKLATMYELSIMTGRSMKTLRSWFLKIGFKREAMVTGTKFALYSVQKYNDLVDKANAKSALKKAYPSRLTTKRKIKMLRAQKFPAMTISKRLGIELNTVLKEI